MSDDTLPTVIDPSVSDCDRFMDKVADGQAKRPNTAALRTMYIGCPPGDQSITKSAAPTNQTAQQLRPKPSLVVPSL